MFELPWYLLVRTHIQECACRTTPHALLPEYHEKAPVQHDGSGSSERQGWFGDLRHLNALGTQPPLLRPSSAVQIHVSIEPWVDGLREPYGGPMEGGILISEPWESRGARAGLGSSLTSGAPPGFPTWSGSMERCFC